MKFERIIWGVLLLFIGGVLLLGNLNVIDFYWRNVWGFWPVFLIIAGINMLLNRNGSQTGSIISLVVLVITLGFLFVKGQEVPKNKSWSGLWNNHGDIGADFNFEDDNQDYETEKGPHFSSAYTAADEVKKTILNITGGGTSFVLDDATDSLFEANVEKKRGNFSLNKTTTDTTNTLTFKMGGKRDGKNRWSFNTSGNSVKLRLNTKPLWSLNLSIGAGELDFDLAKYRVRNLNFDGGAADLKIKLGELLPITDVAIKTGVADVKIDVPTASGCRIKTQTGLSSKDFNGFVKIQDGVYETPNYKTAKNKVFINLDGGLSNFEVNTY